MISADFIHDTLSVATPDITFATTEAKLGNRSTSVYSISKAMQKNDQNHALFLKYMRIRWTGRKLSWVDFAEKHRKEFTR